MDKDLGIIIGIFTTFSIGLINLYFTFKNRKNALREHIYKEQLSVVSKLIHSFYKLNTEISKAYHTRQITDEILFQCLEDVGDVIFQSEYIAPDKILTLANDTVTSCEEFLNAIDSKDSVLLKKEYERYFHNYYALITFIRDSFGINDLSNENQSLYNLPKYYKEAMKNK